MTFSQRVVELTLSIPPGRVTTYGALARAAGGGPLAARSITSILSRYPNHRAIPWHRIVYSDGRAWFSHEHETKRRALYKKEGITVLKNGKLKDFEELLCDFSEFN